MKIAEKISSEMKIIHFEIEMIKMQESKVALKFSSES